MLCHPRTRRTQRQTALQKYPKTALRLDETRGRSIELTIQTHLLVAGAHSEELIANIKQYSGANVTQIIRANTKHLYQSNHLVSQRRSPTS